MAQVTKDMCEYIIRYADKGEHFPLTVNEMRQLAYMSLQHIERGFVTTAPDDGQSPGMPNAICHACGLGRACINPGCPNT